MQRNDKISAIVGIKCPGPAFTLKYEISVTNCHIMLKTRFR